MENADLTARTLSVECAEGCGATVEVTQVEISGRLFPSEIRPTICEACLRGREEAERREAEQAAAEELERKRDGRARSLSRLMAEAGASPWEHGHCTFDGFDTSESGPEPLAAARQFVTDVLEAGTYDPVPGLYLAGPTGTGKSHLASAVLCELLLRPEIDPGTLVYDPADVLISRIRSLYGGRGDVDAFLRRRERARVWILDDLGREPPHPDVVGHLTMLIAQRAMRGTLITGNLAPEEYETRHPDLARIGSRLGPAYFRTVRVEGRDRRFDAARVG